MRCRIVLGSFVRVGSVEEDVARLVKEKIGFSASFSVCAGLTWTVRLSALRQVGFKGLGWLFVALHVLSRQASLLGQLQTLSGSMIVLFNISRCQLHNGASQLHSVGHEHAPTGMLVGCAFDVVFISGSIERRRKHVYCR